MRGLGALVLLVAIHESVLGLYRPPVLIGPPLTPDSPPQTIISLPVQTAVCRYRPSGVLVVRTGVQVSAVGSYLAPVFDVSPYPPPKTIISLPVHMVVYVSPPDGALIMLIGLQMFVAGL